jgi:hypothetical protein
MPSKPHKPQPRKAAASGAPAPPRVARHSGDDILPGQPSVQAPVPALAVVPPYQAPVLPPSPLKRFWLDLAERVFWTFVEGFLGALAIAGLDVPGANKLSILSKAAMAGVMAAIAVVKGLVASKAGTQESASTLPASLDPPAHPFVVPVAAAPRFT